MNLIFKNIKGTEGHYNLERRVIITGDNSAGKSAILDAISIGMLGYHPKIGKTAQAIWRLSSGNPMFVVLDGDEFKWVEKNGKIQATSTRKPLTSPYMLSLKEFFGATKQNRIQVLLEASTPKKSEDIINDAYKAIEKDTPQLRRKELDKLRSQYIEDPMAFFQNVIEWSAKVVSEARAAVTNSESMVAEMTMNYEPGKFSDVSVDIKTAQGKLALLQQDVARRQSEYNANMRNVVHARSVVESVAFDEDRYHKAKRWAVRDGEVQDLRVKADTARDALASAQADLASAKAACDGVVQRHAELVEKLANLGKEMQQCPTCGANHDGWLETAKDMFRAQLTHWTAEKQKAVEVRYERAKVVEALKVEHTALQEKWQSFSSSVTKAKAYLSAYESQVAEVASYKAVLDKAGDMVPPDERAEERMALEAEIGRLEVAQRNFIAQTKAESELEAVRGRVWVCRRAVEEAVSMQKRVKVEHMKFTSEVVDTVVGNANLLIEKVLGQPLSFNGEEFFLGKASIDTLSGSEELIVHAGIQMALAKSSPKLVMMMDELGRCDTARKSRLIEVIDELIEKNVIRYFIGVDVNPPQLNDKWQTISISTQSN